MESSSRYREMQEGSDEGWDECKEEYREECKEEVLGT